VKDVDLGEVYLHFLDEADVSLGTCSGLEESHLDSRKGLLECVFHEGTSLDAGLSPDDEFTLLLRRFHKRRIDGLGERRWRMEHRCEA
jgi:hypothetical protein